MENPLPLFLMGAGVMELSASFMGLCSLALQGFRGTFILFVIMTPEFHYEYWVQGNPKVQWWTWSKLWRGRLVSLLNCSNIGWVIMWQMEGPGVYIVLPGRFCIVPVYFGNGLKDEHIELDHLVWGTFSCCFPQCQIVQIQKCWSGP